MPVFYLDASAIAKMYLPDEQGVDFVSSASWLTPIR